MDDWAEIWFEYDDRCELVGYIKVIKDKRLVVIRAA
jgi:hypothetical protein